MNLKPRSREEPEINLTSLIDVVLLLVVFFMLSSTFIDEGRIKVQLPEASLVPTGKQTDDPLVVTVTQTGGYRVNERELINASPDTLRAAILQVAGADRQRAVTVRADARATHQAVVTAMDVVGRAGFTRVNIATISDPAARQP
ncbi:MAG TPA: biopolymer transporter ExbD [Steroidobacteraceae bacterium]|nr:biopolymer transporter ExbD [Steroidobacteraceae bacterium]HRX89172.1 biopolymer transporter ExbD [Steroidobacteraceae bacterium]